MRRVQAAGFSDIGKVRRANEDNYLINESIGLFVVADGMGGHRAGGVASKIAIDTIAEYMAPPTSPEVEGKSSASPDEVADAAQRLHQSICLANHKIYTQSVNNSAFRGMGTTVSALFLTDNALVTANVGDSPIYLLRNREIENLYTPHTLLHERKTVPKSLAGRISNAKLAHILTRAVGIRSDVKVDFAETPCFADDVVVLCSDGLSGKISREEIRDLVNQHDAETACRKMTALANQRGGEDNITVIVVRIVSMKANSFKGLFGRLLRWPARMVSLLGFRKRATVD